MKKLLGVAAVLLIGFALALSANAASAANGGVRLSTTLLGANEVPGPGDPDGSGTAVLRLNVGQEQICYTLTVSNIAPATAAHIHVGTTDTAGPVVVGLAAPTSGLSSGCTSVDPLLIKAIIQHPEHYYVNVHNAEYPAGALRGQLSN
jgi:hypothetical protein